MTARHAMCWRGDPEWNSTCSPAAAACTPTRCADSSRWASSLAYRIPRGDLRFDASALVTSPAFSGCE